MLDDFSLGLDPGYRRLFIDYLQEYAKAENKTVFLTSHIIQDMERLIDDCIIMDYGKILIQQPVDDLLNNLRRYTFTLPDSYNSDKYEGFSSTPEAYNKFIPILSIYTLSLFLLPLLSVYRFKIGKQD